MNVDSVLLIYLLFTQIVIGMIWWVGGMFLKLSKRSARFWMFASMINGFNLLFLLLSKSNSHFFLNQLLIAQCIAALGIILERRGMQNFFKLPRTDTLHYSITIGIYAFCFGICLPLGWDLLALFISSVFLSLFLCRTILENYRSVTKEFGLAPALMINSSIGSIGLFFIFFAIIYSVPSLQNSWQNNYIEYRNNSVIFFTLIFCVLALTKVYLVLTRLVIKLQHLSHHDSLTGLLNRRAFEFILGRESHRLQRFGEYFSLLTLDIDHFKRINDRLGHAAGDAVLKAIAKTLQHQAREVDKVARYGGEEFCVLLPRTSHESAIQAAERLRLAVINTVVPWQDETISVTISIGVAAVLNSRENLQAMVNRADLALYQAKAQGRNCVVLAQPA